MIKTNELNLTFKTNYLRQVGNHTVLKKPMDNYRTRTLAFTQKTIIGIKLHASEKLTGFASIHRIHMLTKAF